MSLDQFQSYKILPLTTATLSVSDRSEASDFLKASKSSEHTFYILFNAHVPKSDDFPAERTLFMCNLPADASKSHIARIFRKCGDIENIVFPTIPKKRISTCHVIFTDPESVERALAMIPRKRVWAPLDENVTVGLEKWISEMVANKPPLDILEEQSDRAILEFDEMVRQREAELARKRAEPDEDGFILVGGKDAAKRATLKQGKETRVVDFYRFQMREKKKNQLIQLKKQFEQDKKRVEELKQKRKFKPF